MVDAEGLFHICKLEPQSQGTYPDNILVGNEDVSNFHSREDIQELMNALWEAGMRPTCQ